MSTAIEDVIVGHIADRRGLAAGEIDRGVDMFENGYVDSLGVFNMIVLLEEQFGVRFSEQELVDPALYTVAGLAGSIARKAETEDA